MRNGSIARLTVAMGLGWALACGGCSRLKQSILQAKPSPDRRVQAWLETIAPLKSPEDVVKEDDIASFLRQRDTAVIAILKARESGKLSDRKWVAQVTWHLTQIKERGEYGWGMMLHLTDLSIWEMGIEPETMVRLLEPYLTSTDRPTAYVAGEMLGAAQASRRATPQLLTNQLRTDALANEFRSYDPAKAPWKLLDKEYSADPDQVMDALGPVLLDTRAAEELSDDRAELKRLILAFDLTSGTERAENEAHIETTLAELSKHPHWSVRAYALAVLTNGQKGVPRGSHWAKDSAIPTQLLNDPHPFVRSRVASSSGYYYLPDPKMRALFRGEIRN